MTGLKISLSFCLVAQDGAEPSANSSSVGNLVRLCSFTDDKKYLERAGEIIKASVTMLSKIPLALPELVSNYIMYLQPTQQVKFLHLCLCLSNSSTNFHSRLESSRPVTYPASSFSGGLWEPGRTRGDISPIPCLKGSQRAFHLCLCPIPLRNAPLTCTAVTASNIACEQFLWGTLGTGGDKRGILLSRSLKAPGELVRRLV